MQLPTEFWLIRHGQTDWNQLGLYQGQSDIPLNETGTRQAVEIASHLASLGQPFSAVYTSDLLRASQTAERIAASLALPLIPEPGLREICLGAWEGGPYKEIKSHYHRLAELGEDPAQFRPPGGETVAEVAARITETVNRIAAQHPGERVLMVLHGVVISSLLCSARGIPLAEVYQHFPKNAQPVILPWPVNPK